MIVSYHVYFDARQDGNKKCTKFTHCSRHIELSECCQAELIFDAIVNGGFVLVYIVSKGTILTLQDLPLYSLL